MVNYYKILFFSNPLLHLILFQPKSQILLWCSSVFCLKLNFRQIFIFIKILFFVRCIFSPKIFFFKCLFFRKIICFTTKVTFFVKSLFLEKNSSSYDYFTSKSHYFCHMFIFLFGVFNCDFFPTYFSVPLWSQ